MVFSFLSDGTATSGDALNDGYDEFEVVTSDPVEFRLLEGVEVKVGNGVDHPQIKIFVSLSVPVGIRTLGSVRHGFFPQINHPWIRVRVWINP